MPFNNKNNKRKPFRKNQKQEESITTGPKSLNKMDKPITSTLEELGKDIRLNKYVAHCGICSRRKAGEYIFEGLVKVNGAVKKEPGYRISPTDEVQFKDKVVESLYP